MADNDENRGLYRDTVQEYRKFLKDTAEQLRVYAKEIERFASHGIVDRTAYVEGGKRWAKELDEIATDIGRAMTGRKKKS